MGIENQNLGQLEIGVCPSDSVGPQLSIAFFIVFGISFGCSTEMGGWKEPAGNVWTESGGI
jgi:hypothetical protein